MSEPVGPRLARVLGLALLALQVPVLLKTATDPSQSDFANYFVPAFVLAHGQDVGALYDRDAFSDGVVRAGLTGLGSFVPHPPTNALWQLPFAWLNPADAKLLWTIVLLAALGVTIAGLRHLLPDESRHLALPIALAPVLSIRNGLAFGQPYLILTALIACGVLALRRDHPFSGAFLFGIGAVFKPYALILGLLFVHRDRLRSVAGFVAGALTPCLVLWLLAGANPFIAFVDQVLPWMSRGDIQDPFSMGWGSATALANRLFRFEPDLNPTPWIDAPLMARFLGASVSAFIVAVGLFAARRALVAGEPLAAVGAAVAFALAASPFAASYHVVLLSISIASACVSLQARSRLGVLMMWFAVGSLPFAIFRDAASPLSLLAYTRFLVILAIGFIVARPWLDRTTVFRAALIGVVLGVIALPWSFRQETWPRVMEARGYSSYRPHFCGENLRWLSPSSDGRRIESRGVGDECATAGTDQSVRRVSVDSRFTDGSWNLYARTAGPHPVDSRLTFSDANEMDPVITPDGCEVVFASDQGRGLGSTALYRLRLGPLSPECDRAAPASAPR